MKIKILFTLILCILLTNKVLAYEKSKITNNKNTFSSISLEIKDMTDLFSGDYNSLISFDSKKAKELGFSKEAITLATEMKNATNEIIKGNNTEGFSIKNYKIKNLQLLKYLREAKKYKGNIPLNNNENTLSISNITAETICGAIWNPKPSIAAPWTYHLIGASQADKEFYLSINGFHQTAIDYGGGWTRAQNYQSWICGNGSYRDHAIIYSNFIVMQDYSGFTPRGEPNPEIFSYICPYSTWPLYLYWWHDTY